MAFYSVLKATTGSFLAALFAGRTPDIKVRTILSIIIKSACKGGRAAILNPMVGFKQIFKISEIKMYENGIMSLNPKFYFRRVVTKTTHPKTMYLINKILNELLYLGYDISHKGT